MVVLAFSVGDFLENMIPPPCCCESGLDVEIWQEYVNFPTCGGESCRVALECGYFKRPLSFIVIEGDFAEKARFPSASLKEVLGAMRDEFPSKGGSLKSYGPILSRLPTFLRWAPMGVQLKNSGAWSFIAHQPGMRTWIVFIGQAHI